MRALRATALALLVLLLGLETWALATRELEGRAPLPAGFGNHGALAERLPDPEPSGRFAFAVVGDTRGDGTFERIADGLRSEPLAFLVLLGDVAREGTPEQHEFVRAEIGELDLPYPVLWVPGNHDVDPEGFSIEDFERSYGPSNFWFGYQDCLFLFLRVLPGRGQSDEGLAFARRVLAAERGRYRRAFGFMHIPPPLSDEIYAKPFERAPELVRLFERFRVDYVFAGDHHGHAQVERQGVRYVVSGGGGARLRDGALGAFHHAVVLDVEPEGVMERILVVPHHVDLEDVAERLALTRLVPWLEASPGQALLLHGLLLAGCLPGRSRPGVRRPA